MQYKPHFSDSRAPILTCLGVAFCATLAFSSQIVLPNESASPGATILVQLGFASQATSVSGVQFDIEYDNSALSLTATLSDSAKSSGKNLYAVDLAANEKRFLIIGLNQTLIADGNLMNLYVKISPNAPGGAYALALSNVCGTDPSGQPLALTTTNGTLNVTAASVAQPQLTSIENSGSFLPGPLAPGELVTLVGNRIGPSSLQIPSGSATNIVLGGTSVLFDSKPALLLYASPNQINAIVPYGVSGETTTQVTVAAEGQIIATTAQNVAAAAPAIFTINSSGAGPGAILNQDSTVNSPSNPAARGSIVAIYATGAGQTTPPGIDGQVTGSVLPTPLLPISVQIGGLDAKVLYAGAAPRLISGVVQVNAMIPSNASSGPTVPIVLGVGAAKSQSGVTVAIQ